MSARQRCFEQFTLDHEAIILGGCVSAVVDLGSPRIEIRDIVQDVELIIWATLDTILAASNPSNYLREVVTNAARRAVRREQRSPEPWEGQVCDAPTASQ